MTRIMLDPSSLFGASRQAESAARELQKIGLSLGAYALPEMPPHARARVENDLRWASQRTIGMALGVHHLGEELSDRAQLAVVAGAGDAFAGMLALLAPALKWLYGGKGKPGDEDLKPGDLFGGADEIWKRRHLPHRQWSDTWWKGENARNMPWGKPKDGDKEWLDAGVKIWSKDLLDEEANLWEKSGSWYNVAAVGASAKAGVSFKLDREGLKAGVDGRAAAYLFRGDVGFDGKYGDANAGVFAGGMAEGKAGLRATTKGVYAEGGAKAFVGGEAHGSAHAKALGVKAGGSASVSYGLGAEAKGEAALGLDKIKLSGKVGLTFGLGGSVGVDLEWSPEETFNDVADIAKKIPKPKVDWTPWN